MNGLEKISLKKVDAVIFDMDGVVTDTASVHAAAWKHLFDEYLQERARRTGEQFRPFDANIDYYRYVDGKPRYDGVESFLKSRRISLPRGNPNDTPDQETVWGLGNKKNGYFLNRIKKQGVDAYKSSVELIQRLKAGGILTAVISSSRNCSEVLEAAGVRDLFDVEVNGVDVSELGLKGKPDPAIFLEAARRLNVDPARTLVVEDSLAGVDAGRRGEFALVVGVDRLGHPNELKNKGADVVVRDLSELEIRGSGRKTAVL